MNREIKFRAWLPKLNKMTHSFEVKYAHLIFGHDAPVDIVIMQFTGLKDRNGVEIYEGDIVNEDLATNGKWQSIGAVEFFEGSFGSRNGHGRFRIPALFSGEAIKGMNLNYYEIIGNIYQSPELIPIKIIS